MKRNNPIQYAATLLALAVLVFAALVASSSIAQVPANRSTEIPHPEIAKQMLRIRMLEKQLDKLIEAGEEDQDEINGLVAAIEERYDSIHELQQQLQKKLGQKKQSYAEVINAERSRRANEQMIAAAKAQAEAAKVQFEKQLAMHRSEEEASLARSQRMKAEMQKLQVELQKAHEELKIAKRSISKSQPLQSLPVSLFKLKYVRAAEVLDTMEHVLGNAARLSVAEPTNLLLVQAEEEQLVSIRNILTEIDQPESQVASGNDQNLPPAMMVRIFWLSDGEPSADAPSADSILPSSVCDALTKIGIYNPFLAAQGTTTFALQDEKTDPRSNFRLEKIPAELFGDQLFLTMLGEATSHDSGQPKLSLQCYSTKKIGDELININEFMGSVVTPLDHYVILGTNSYVTNATTGMGRRMGMGGQFGGEGGYGGRSEEKKPQQTVSQFAYVLQVVAAETFGPAEE